MYFIWTFPRINVFWIFFCSNCKSYEDALLSGTGTKIKRTSKHFRCTANHTDFMFPTHRIFGDAFDDNVIVSSSPSCNACVVADDMNDSRSGSDDNSGAEEEDGGIPSVADELVSYYGALTCMESAFMDKLQLKADRFEALLEKELCKTESEVSLRFEYEMKKLNNLIEAQKVQLGDLKEKNDSLSRHLNYYKKKAKRNRN